MIPSALPESEYTPGRYAELRQIADQVERFGLRRAATRLRTLAEDGKVDERPCPIQDRNGGEVRAIPWGLAEMLYPAYGSHEQTLERLAERGGFGRYELGLLAVGMYNHAAGTRTVIRAPWQRNFPLLDIYRGPRGEQSR
jgi:hypothetical protein